ncbi:xanthine dehydrogenase family protein molybdopterin-binding subunit [Desulfoscipio gibsoniae]|uniref:Aerobic-type carbon monoxide dehydrogenase, large subunit CoxL/CutL-like protein n=1 Tax=Desulfoscipio gibsoniae DSM 7213 TaxID=767817 RepID=R4KEC6_9FIRM|nr:xanthine dehydrogenase family protein molybdopterin-binding subunit [Desulfoscipio gibsoniae]AGK99996.1 aerobic-type carbon monoxide dehydrogenase, large subunit CoxL/CutL-like protein [Desulfoscipio gibsoniae DSM 7213]
MNESFNLIGKSLPKVDGLSKATGKAQYTSDISFPGMLYCKLLRSPFGHAKIIGIDYDEVLSQPGVIDIMLGGELTIPFGILPVSEDEHALAIGKVRYVGDPVAAVVAVDEATAEAALALFKVEYEPLPAFLTVEDALLPAAEPIHTYTGKGNIHREIALEFGDVETGFNEADHIREDLFFYSGSTHMCLEEHASVAVPENYGHLTLYTSSQTPHYLHRALAKVLGKPAAHVRVVSPFIGGGFGGKSEPFSHEMVASYLALKTGCPVKITLTREEVFYTHRGRHATLMAVKTGVKRDGTITAMQFTNFLDGGAHGSFGVASSYYTGNLQTTTYKIPNYKTDIVRCFTNKPAAGPKRGHAAPQGRFAIELQLDKLAEDIGISPVEIRKINAIEPNSLTVNYLRVTSCGLLECIERVDRASDFTAKHSALPYGKGVGFAVGAYMCGAGLPIYFNPLDHSQVILKIDRGGGVTLYSGSTDIGQGSLTVHALLVAEILGLQMEDIYLVAADTALTPVDMGSYSSRVTFMSGNAAIQAARQLRDTIAQAVAEKLQVDSQSLVFKEGKVMERNNPDKQIPFSTACALAEARSGLLVGRGGYKPPDLAGPYRGSGVGPSPAYSYSAAVVEVTCDPVTGLVKVEKVWVAHDIGIALNPLNVIGQIEGNVYMGLGDALMEEQTMRRHLLKAPSMLDYKTFTTLDMPPVESILVETAEAEGPFGAKEAGQGPLLPVVPALVNAVYNAVGVRIDEVPVTPEKILKALDDKAKGGSGRYGRKMVPQYKFPKPQRVPRPWDDQPKD